MERQARRLARWAARLRDLSALLSGDPERILRRALNREIGRAIGRLTRPLYLRRNRRGRQKP
jgi:hypothetical protein